MEIYVVQPGDTINSIALKFNISSEKLIADNGLISPNTLALGQALVILHPKETYIVQENDTLATIADSYQISLLQLVRNNPFLYDRQYISPGETLVISYNTVKDIQVHSYTYAFINQDLLERALPYLTYLSVYNYQAIENTIITNESDDDRIIELSKKYNTIPLLMVSAYSSKGELDIEYAYQLLLDDTQQEKLINDLLQIMESKGYYGLNLLVGNITHYNQSLYLKAFTRISQRLKNAGYFFLITISIGYSMGNGYSLKYADIDYNSISLIVDNLVFMQDVWGEQTHPPAPVSNISLIKPFIEYVTGQVSVNNISIGKPQIAFDWALPYIPGSSEINTLSLQSAIILAYEKRATIQLDEESQTPYYLYEKLNVRNVEDHIVWFIDARSIRALDEVIINNNLPNTGIWYIGSYNQQVFSMINANYSIIKMIVT